MKHMIIVIALFIFTYGTRASAHSEDCISLTQIIMEMNAVASNIANANTTRTPEGGPYRLKTFECSTGDCNFRSELKVKNVYEPSHPDASADGYVTYPAINIFIQKLMMEQLIRSYQESTDICIQQNLESPHSR